MRTLVVCVRVETCNEHKEPSHFHRNRHRNSQCIALHKTARGKPNIRTQVTTLYTKSQPRKVYYKFSAIAPVNFYEVTKMEEVTL